MRITYYLYGMNTASTEKTVAILSAITGSSIPVDFGEPFRRTFLKHYPNGSNEEIAVAAYTCSLFLSAILKGFSTDRLHTFVHNTGEECSRFTFDCRMYDTLLGSIDEHSLQEVSLIDDRGEACTCKCSRNDILEAFDFYTNR
ncbi:MAG: hypothetical protein IJF06_05935 [Bacteroidaceae bacterium]|nr:hypothetical protein [Bacteroidaceae bacterium]